jgi:hypothetical protein
MIDIRSNIKEIERRLSALAWKQVPFATSQALNALGRTTIKMEQANEQKELDKPKPFTTGALRLIGASKGRQYVTIRMLDATARYLAPYQDGGKNTLNGKALLKPVGAMTSLDQFGNLPRSLLRQLKGRSDVFIGRVQTKAGIVSGVWQRSVAEGSRVQARKGSKVVRTSKGLNTGGHLKLLIKFEDAHDVKQNLDWFGVAERHINSQFNKEFGKALAKAMATARR